MTAQRDDSKVVGWDQVREAEIKEVVLRRQAAGVGLPQESRDEQQAGSHVERTGIGLALSGGGIRSASFNLGVLQALYAKGLLRFVDYLASVSGGGYVAAHWASRVLRSELSLRDSPAPVAAEQGSQPEGTSAETFAPRATGQQSASVLRLIHGGLYLARPLRFVNWWLIGFFLIAVLVVSGLISAAALMAIAFRCLDLPAPMRWVTAFGFRDDVTRAFFPSFVLFLAWFVAWSISYWRDGFGAKGKVAQVLAVFLIASFLLGLAGLVGTGDIDLSFFSRRLGVDEVPQETSRLLTEKTRTVGYVFGGLVVLALLPFLVPRRLLRSGVRPRKSVERVIFWLATRALLLGVPLVVFGILARENISHFNEKRPFLRVQDLERPEVFWAQVVDEYKANREPGKSILLAAQRAFDREYVDRESAEGRRHGVETKEAAADFWKTYQLAVKVDSPASGSDSHGYRSWDDASWDQAGKTRASGITETGKQLWQELRKHKQTALQKIEKELKAGDGTVKTAEPPAVEYVMNRIHATNGRLDRANWLNERISIPSRAWLIIDCWAPSKNEVDVVRENLQKYRDRLDRVFDAITEDVVDRAGLYAHLKRPPADNGREAQAAKRSAEFIKLVDKAKDLEYEKLPKVAEALVSEPAALDEEIAKNNRKLLRLHYSDSMWDETPAYASVVAIKDQSARLAIFGWSTAIFLISLLFLSLNDTSLHRFYREQLSKMWIEDVPGFGRTIPLAQLDTTAQGAPYHLVSATLNWLGVRAERTEVPQEHFLFSKAYCGADSTRYQATGSYLSGTYDLASAVAISGAAVSPLQVPNPLISILLFLLNFRLGQWLPHPGKQKISRHVVPWRLIGDLVRNYWRREKDWKYFFVTDGGHYENLGLEPLLLRRCKLILVSDATCDPQFSFGDFLRVQQRMRIQRGIRFVAQEYLGAVPLQDLQLNPARPAGFCRSHFFVARILYPPRADGQPEEAGYLIYLKPTFTGDEGTELWQYRQRCEEFPHDATTDQFFEPERFEAYRNLGYHIGQELGDALLPVPSGDVNVAELLAQLTAPPQERRQEGDVRQVIAKTAGRRSARSHCLPGRVARRPHRPRCAVWQPSCWRTWTGGMTPEWRRSPAVFATKIPQFVCNWSGSWDTGTSCPPRVGGGWLNLPNRIRRQKFDRRPPPCWASLRPNRCQAPESRLDQAQRRIFVRMSPGDSRDQPGLASGAGEHFQREVDFVGRMNRRNARPQTRGIHRYRGEHDGDHQQALGATQTCHLQGDFVVARHHRHDGRDARPRVKAEILQTGQVVFQAFPELSDQFRFTLQDLQRRHRHAGLTGRQRPAENVPAGVVPKIGDDLLPPRHETAAPCERLGERAHFDVDILGGQAEVLLDTPSRLA